VFFACRSRVNQYQFVEIMFLVLLLIAFLCQAKAQNAEDLAERLHGRGLHAIDDMIRALTGREESVLGTHLRDETGSLFAMDLTP